MSSRKGQCQTEMSFYWHSWESGKGSARQRWAFIDLVESQERAVPDRDELLLTLLRVRKGQRQTERSFYWQSWESGKGSEWQTEMSFRKGQCQTEMSFYWQSWESGKGSVRQRWASGKGSARQRWAPGKGSARRRWAFIDRVENRSW